MSVQTKADSPLKAVVSVASMCRLLKMSRSHFYWHVKRGTFHAPLRLASNGRPYFTASMVEDNLRARESGVGTNGEYVLFYERQPTNSKPEGKRQKANHAALLEGLRSLGLTAVTTEQVDGALAACFPTGIGSTDETNVLRQVFRHLKRSGVG
jgi:predicted DNA-binding transcriptional regulator AlpA